jgi:hypothetical protein
MQASTLPPSHLREIGSVSQRCGVILWPSSSARLRTPSSMCLYISHFTRICLVVAKVISSVLRGIAFSVLRSSKRMGNKVFAVQYRKDTCEMRVEFHFARICSVVAKIISVVHTQETLLDLRKSLGMTDSVLRSNKRMGYKGFPVQCRKGAHETRVDAEERSIPCRLQHCPPVTCGRSDRFRKDAVYPVALLVPPSPDTEFSMCLYISHFARICLVVAKVISSILRGIGSGVLRSNKWMEHKGFPVQ